RTAAGRRVHPHRLQDAVSADRVPLCALRGPSGPCIWRRSASHRQAVLQQWRGVDVRRARGLRSADAMVRGLLLALLALAIQSAHAWGHAGHRIVAELAWAQLTPQARAGVNRLLALEPGASLASAASWADESRDDATRTWHFVN